MEKWKWNYALKQQLKNENKVSVALLQSVFVYLDWS